MHILEWKTNEIKRLNKEVKQLIYDLAAMEIERDKLKTDLAAARALLRRVLSCGLCEEPRGIGFSPSKQELKASALVTDISAALAGEKK